MKTIVELKKEIEERSKRFGGHENSYLKTQLQTLNDVFGMIDEFEFTNLLREHKCINVNSVMDDIKTELKQKIKGEE